MIFGRGRKHDRAEALDEPGENDDLEAEAQEPSTPKVGPFDASDVDLDDPDGTRLDLGALLVSAHPDVEVRLQVDESSGTVLAVLVVTEESALELRPFAAPRSEGIWAEVRREIAAEATRQGGTASESVGPFGAELLLALPVQTPQGRPGTQVSRIVGIDGPRWLLRGTFMGRAVEPAAAAVLDDVLRNVVVVRGSAPMAPREPLPLALPAPVQLPEDPAAP